MTQEHTPAPWHTERDSYSGRKVYSGGTKLAYIARIESLGGSTDLEADANMHLVAAAPELLAALIIAHEWSCDFEADRPCTTENCLIQHVIAKARGGAVEA